MAALLLCIGACSPALAAVPHWAKSCKALNARYAHGVGRIRAHDHVRGGTEPVTSFKRSNALYALAKGRDRDKDKVACEKA